MLPVKGGVENSYGKVNILLQVYIWREAVESFSLTSDLAYVAQVRGREREGMGETKKKTLMCCVSRSGFRMQVALFEVSLRLCYDEGGLSWLLGFSPFAALWTDSSGPSSILSGSSRNIWVTRF